MSPENFKNYLPKTMAEAIAWKVVDLAIQGDKAAIQIAFESLKLSAEGKTEIRIVEK